MSLPKTYENLFATDIFEDRRQSHRGIFKTAIIRWKCIHCVVPAYPQELCVPQEMSEVVYGYDLHRLDVSSCQECRYQLDSRVSRSLGRQNETVWFANCHVRQ